MPLHILSSIHCQLMQVIDCLTSSVELTDLIKNVDSVFHSKVAGEPTKSLLTEMKRYIPTIRQQLQVFNLFVILSPWISSSLYLLLCFDSSMRVVYYTCSCTEQDRKSFSYDAEIAIFFLFYC